jgi:hypothetical protein
LVDPGGVPGLLGELGELAAVAPLTLCGCAEPTRPGVCRARRERKLAGWAARVGFADWDRRGDFDGPWEFCGDCSDQCSTIAGVLRGGNLPEFTTNVPAIEPVPGFTENSQGLSASDTPGPSKNDPAPSMGATLRPHESHGIHRVTRNGPIPPGPPIHIPTNPRANPATRWHPPGCCG